MQELFVGIDISKKELVVAIFPTGETFCVPYQEKEISSFRDRLLTLCPKKIVMEATGGLERELCLSLAEVSLPMCIVNPRQVHAFKNAIGTLCKTDAVDATILARFGEAMKPELTPIPEGVAQELSDLFTRRRQLVMMGSEEHCRCLQTHSSVVRQGIEKHLQQLKQDLEEINQRLAEAIQQHPVWKEKDELLQGVPGIGAATSAALLSELSELGTLTGKQIASLVGVAPHAFDSGQFRGKRQIWGGRALVRKALYMATLVATKWNPVIRAFYLRLQSRGKEKKVALVACMRKLLVTLNAMLKHKTSWRAIA